MNDIVKIEKDMTPKLIGETWQKPPTSTNKQSVKRGIYECQYCGVEFEASSGNIQSGHTRSCGCQKGGNTHGLSHNQFYKTWDDMIRRCNNLKSKDYKHYGARGITVCEEWLDIKKFIAWAESTHPNVKGVTLDRINNDKGYSPENCTWSDKTTQNINQRMKKNNTSGYVGVYWNKGSKKWVVNIRISKILKQIGSFKDKIEAVLARNNYIIENNLPHKLSTEY